MSIVSFAIQGRMWYHTRKRAVCQVLQEKWACIDWGWTPSPRRAIVNNALLVNDSEQSGGENEGAQADTYFRRCSFLTFIFCVDQWKSDRRGGYRHCRWVTKRGLVLLP